MDISIGDIENVLTKIQNNRRYFLFPSLISQQSFILFSFFSNLFSRFFNFASNLHFFFLSLLSFSKSVVPMIPTADNRTAPPRSNVA